MKKLLTGVVLCLPLLVNAAWQADQSNSTIHFLSTKKQHIVEVHSFDRFTANVADNGDVSIKIDLTSVNTAIPIRNERMQKFLFETTQFSSATLTAKVEPSVLKQLGVGQTIKQTVVAQLSIHGETQAVSVDVSVTGLQNGGALVQSVKPLLIDARQFGMTAGVDKLKELAGLPSIGYVVPVTFSLNLAQ
ncbi:YceI family protein [Saccharobesus litoralis]|uniref:YceI family protein n=1 Tax=Saccharobesus litoralis TaxID=2172099 RepID=A0A2S0VWR3_9ALTE|nr:YceI family protein [Saccharobesus litoralis]AWB68664.1 YceI family protein [Saccharobesus litoralis]